jgi:uncharacterized protein YggE
VDRTITVTATGEASGTPDTAELNLGVRFLAAGATEALRAASRRARDLIDALHASGITGADIATLNIAVWPQYSNAGNRVVGYEATNDLRVRFRDPARAGEVIDAAAVVVGDAFTINSLSLLIDDPSGLEVAARQAAVAAARRDAEVLATAAGAQVGPVVSIVQHGHPGADGPVARGKEMFAMSQTAPLEPGTQRVTSQVTVVFALSGE